MNDMLRQEQEVRLALPFPPSVNNLFLNARGRGRVPSPLYRQWREDAGWAVKAQRPGAVIGPVVVSLELTPPDNRSRDIDNLIKPVLDLLVELQVIVGDDMRTVRKVEAAWVNGDPCTVTIRKAA